MVKLLCATLRFRIEDPDGFLKKPATVRMTGIFWHNRLFIIPWFFTRYMRPRISAALASPSRDGDILSAFLKQFGIETVRGSSSRRGVAAMLEMKRAADAGYDIAITPDGPRGPQYRLNPGVIALAQTAGIYVLPISVFYSRHWTLKSWDAFQIPKPFATVTVHLHPLVSVPATESEDEFEAQRLRLEEIMRAGQHIANDTD